MNRPGSLVDRTASRSWALDRVERDLRAVMRTLAAEPSSVDVRAAHATIDLAERTLGELVQDPWEPSAGSVRRARDILSSHLLAASACEGAEVAPSVTARVLRRGADAAWLVLVETPE